MLTNLETLFDMSVFEELDKEICLGIASSDLRTPTPGIHQVGVTNPSEIIKKYKDDPTLSHLSTNQQRLFLKLYEKALLPARSVYIRNFVEKYHDKWDAEKCQWHPNAQHFPKLVEWIKNNDVFESVGRVEVFMLEAYAPVPLHEDYCNTDPNDPKEFIWVNIRGDKPFWCINDMGEKVYLERVAWFDDDILHGADPVEWMAYSFRIDGVFTKEFKSRALSLDRQIGFGEGAKVISPKWDDDWLTNLYD